VLKVLCSQSIIWAVTKALLSSILPRYMMRHLFTLSMNTKPPGGWDN